MRSSYIFLGIHATAEYTQGRNPSSEFCGKRFNNSSTYQRHMSQHRSEMSYVSMSLSKEGATNRVHH